MTVSSSSGMENDLTEALGQVLLGGKGKEQDEEAVEGLDEDLIAYMAGMLSSRVEEEHDASTWAEVVPEVLLPFLESVQCPESRQEQALEAALAVLRRAQDEAAQASHSKSSSSSAARKLTQGVVNMGSNNAQSSFGSDVSDAWNLLPGGDQRVKAMANNLIDAHSEKSSAKEKRKARKVDAERARKLLASSHDEDADQGPGSNNGLLVRMRTATAFSVDGDLESDAANNKKRDVQVRNVTVALDNGTTLLESGELKFVYQRRYGLIGENGVGKSTLLKAIAKEDGIEGFPKNLRVLHVRQEVPSHISNELTVMQAVLESDVERNLLLQQEKELLAKLDQAGETATTLSSAPMTIQERRKKLSEQAAQSDEAMQAMTADLKRLDAVYARLQLLSADSAESRAATILSGLQFSPERQQSPLSSLSGGWRMRVALAAALFIEPDICMLDEPTNHLDLEAVLWLESYLVTYKHTLIVVSHDRGFLNEVCTDIIEFKSKKLSYYRGNFDNYVKLRDENTRNAMRVYQAYQAKREHMMEFIDKFRANAKRASMVQSRIKAVEKMDAEAPEAVTMDAVWRFSIPNSEPVSRPIISVNDVCFDYSLVLPDGTPKPESQYLLQDVNFGVDLTSRIAILGANGQGKTTLLNLIMGKIRPIKGSVVINGNLRIGHFTQHSGDNFDLKLSAVENMLNMFDEAEDQEIRSFLGKFQIQGNDALKPMMLLSGGQKSRVAFAALAYKKPHVLVIDEGSNHLSMEAVDALVEAIQDFKGGVLVVSHDQYFVSKTCTELWVVHEGKATRFRGDFDEYRVHTAELTQKRVEESVKRMNALNN